MRNSYKYPKDNRFSIDNLLAVSKSFEYSSLLLSNNLKSNKYSSYETILALGAKNILKSNRNSFQNLRDFHKLHNDWIFGFLSYDLKNEIEDLTSKNIDEFNIPNLLFYVPETILFIQNENVLIQSIHSKSKIDLFVNSLSNLHVDCEKVDSIELTSRESKKEYLEKINKIKSHIQNGDIYEMNYCQEFYSLGKDIDPRSVFLNLNNINKSPFSVYFNFENNYLLCSSPERFLKKKGIDVVSQPIKGTRRRGVDKKEDELLSKLLRESKKDISENVMIVDLVRNDLSRTAKKATVNVEELLGIYTFETVHQMITTVTSQLDDQFDFVDLLETTFPMGSMTGAPKIKAMELIEKFEISKRSLFSSAFGYITPDGDFDFNVVIRSIVYNEINKYISVMSGGAITINSDPEEEYEECLLKSHAMIKSLNHEG